MQKELDKSSGPCDTALAPSIDLDANHALFTDPESVTILVPLLGDTPPDHQSLVHKAYVVALSHATSRISSQGIASGYITGILLLLLALVPITQMDDSTFLLCLAIGLSGVWWMLFSIPTAVWLPLGGTATGINGRSEPRWGLHGTPRGDAPLVASEATPTHV